MNAVLLSAGAIAIIAAVVGGGLQLFDVDVPVITSRARQVLLFVVGVAFVGTAWLLREQSGDGGVAAYRGIVAASCERMAGVAARPIDNGTYASRIDNTFRKDALVRDLRARHAEIATELTALWRRPAPEDLRDDRAAAEDATGQWLAQFGRRVDQLAALPKDVVSQDDANAVAGDGDTALRVGATDAMTALAGRNCPIGG